MAFRKLRLLALLLVALAAPAQAASGKHRQQSTATAPVCPPQPFLVLSEDFADPRGEFATGARALRRIQTRFAAAFRRACARDQLHGWRLMGARAQQGDRVFLVNQPNSFGAWIRLDGEENALSGDRRIVLEFPFLGADGAVSVPRGNQLDHAILCGVEGRYWRPDQDILACLVD